MPLPRSPTLVLCLLVGLATAITNLNLPEHEVCKKGNPPWRCTKFSACLSAPSHIKQGRRPELCGFDGKEAVVCCQPQGTKVPSPNPRTTPPAPKHPPSERQKPPQRQPVQPHDTEHPNAIPKSEEMCRKYAELVYSYDHVPAKTEKTNYCAISLEGHITEDTNANPREFPHMALLGFGSRRNTVWKCAASLISENFILGPAHCSYHSRGEGMWARLGELDLAREDEDAKVQMIAVSNIITHPGYRQRTLSADIALYRLQRSATLSPYVRPACLPQWPDLEQAWHVTAHWTNSRGPKSSILSKVSLRPIHGGDCEKSYGSSFKADSMLCVRTPRHDCWVEGGGPLLERLERPFCMHAVAGVHTFGKEDCTRHPAVFTRVYPYLSWIEQHVWR